MNQENISSEISNINQNLLFRINFRSKMTKKYIHVIHKKNSYRLFKADLKRIYSAERHKLPVIPSYSLKQWDQETLAEFQPINFHIAETINLIEQ